MCLLRKRSCKVLCVLRRDLSTALADGAGYCLPATRFARCPIRWGKAKDLLVAQAVGTNSYTLCHTPIVQPGDAAGTLAACPLKRGFPVTFYACLFVRPLRQWGCVETTKTGLARDYERLPQTQAAIHVVVFAGLMLAQVVAHITSLTG